MILSPDYKRFKHSTITGDTLHLSDTRSSIIRTIEGCNHYPNTANLKRLEKEAQNKEIQQQKTDRIPTVYDRAILALPYADMVIISDHTLRPDVSRPSVSTSHGQAFKKPKTYPINEMIPILVYYSYATKYHKLSSMFVPGYQYSNVFINVEKKASMNKDIQ